MAKWNITAVEPVVSTITATVSGSAITTNVNRTSAELKLATGSAVGITNTSIVTVDNFGAKAKVSATDETEVKGTMSCSASAVKVGHPFAVVFMPEDKVRYKPITILLTIQVAEEETGK